MEIDSSREISWLTTSPQQSSISKAAGIFCTLFEKQSKVVYLFSLLVLPDTNSRHPGHQNLWNAGILHGDINEGNIIIGTQSLLGGRAAVLIDLDLAIRVDHHSDGYFHENV